jgi:predicted dienelactone hydrolase
MRQRMHPAPWLFGLALACAAPVRAEDACLTGASTLGDQRGMAAFRTDLESACPCATAASRASWRRCAKDVLAAALGDATLRTECERSGRRLVKGTTCGTNRVACGGFRATAAEPVSCQVRRNAMCADTRKVERTPCDAQTFCADVVDWTAGTCSDVRARGPYGAGVTHIVFTKQSAVDPTQPRPLDTYIWYPTTPGAGPIDGATNAVLDAPLDASGGPYPIVLFSHGSCGYALQSTFLMPLIAARGYVVVAPPHPGNTIFDGLAVCGALETQIASAVERPADMTFVLDEMLAENADPGSRFFGALDPSRVAMTGHSFGGLTTYLVQARDPRITVAVPMAPATGPSQPGLTVPSLTILGEIDTRVSDANAEAAYDRSVTPRALAVIEHAGHYAFSNLCFPGPDCNPPTTLTQDEAHAAVLRWVIPFLEWRLGGDDAFAAFFEAPQPPGVVVVQAD